MRASFTNFLLWSNHSRWWENTSINIVWNMIMYVTRWSKQHKLMIWMSMLTSVFYLKFFEHPSFGQVAHEIYPSEWKVHSSEISITIMYCWYMFLMAVATDFTHVTINLVCCCLSPILISHKRSCWKISQSLKPIWLDVEMLVPLFF